MSFQLIIQFELNKATVDDFDRLLALENELRIALKEQHDVKGHQLGIDQINIIIHTDNPDEAFTLCRTILSNKELETVLVAYKELDGDNFYVLWPENYNGAFKIT